MTRLAVASAARSIPRRSSRSSAATMPWSCSRPAVAHFGVFDELAAGPVAPAELQRAMGLGERQFTVLLTGLKAMQVWSRSARAACSTTPLAREHLAPGQPLDVSDYIRLAAESPGVLTLVEHMRKNTLAGVAKDDDAGGVHLQGRPRIGDGGGRLGPALHADARRPGEEHRAGAGREGRSVAGQVACSTSAAARACMRLPFCSAIRSCERSSSTGPPC